MSFPTFAGSRNVIYSIFTHGEMGEGHGVFELIFTGPG